MARMHSAPLLLVLSLALLLPGCSTPRGSKTSQFAPDQLIKSDIDRMADMHRRQLDESLYLLADKLYRRNPREWRKMGFASHEAAVQRLTATDHWRLKELNGVAGTDAVLMALKPDYSGDRVAAYVAGLGSMIHAAFGERTNFHMLDDIDPQKLYNAARNIEIAAWKLASSRDANGELLLLSNEMYPVANLSFEREAGKMISNLDLISLTIADKTNRTVVKIVQSVATAVFLPVAAVLK